MQERYEFARSLLQEAADYLKIRLDEELIIEEKSSQTDLVTHLDKAVQDFMVQKIIANYPNDHIIGEESKEHPDMRTGSVWVIDPIDGTTNFIVQKTDFTIMLAYVEEGRGQFGCIYDVMAGKLYYGGPAFGAFVNGHPLPKASYPPLSKSLLAANSTLLETNYRGLADLGRACLGTRSYGSAGISASYVLSGRLVGYVSYIYPWDYMASLVIGESLGFVVRTLDGQEPDYKSRQYIMMVPKDKLDEIQGYIR